MRIKSMDPQRQRLYEVCQARGVGITVMKAFGGGGLLDASLSPAGKALTASQCLHYALTRPAVACVLAGAQGEVPETVREHYGALEHHAGECIACGVCEKRCPFQVSIVENMRRAKAIFGK